MPLWIEISPGSDAPIYEQIVEQVSRAVAQGRLLPGERLPAVRKLAEELVVNPNTVAKAFQLLEQQGLISTRVGSGTFVAHPDLRKADQARINTITERLDNLITHCINLGLDGPAIRRLLEGRLSRFKEPKRGDRHE